MANQTTVGAQMAKVEKDRLAAQDVEDAAALAAPAPVGKVWVRLVRPHLDADGVWHDAGVASLNANAIPKSAIRLSKAEETAAEAPSEE
jgi:hypothetical protein